MLRSFLLLSAALALFAACGGSGDDVPAASRTIPTAAPARTEGASSVTATASSGATASPGVTLTVSPTQTQTPIPTPVGTPTPTETPAPATASPTVPAATPAATQPPQSTATATEPPPPPPPTPTPVPTAVGGPLQATVNVDENFFAPRTAKVGVGGTVTWVWVGKELHDIKGPFGGSGLHKNWSYSATFSNPGSYAYSCSIHEDRNMRGTIIVE